MKKLVFLYSLFQMYFSYKTGGPTLLEFATFIKGETPFPEFSAVLMLDDIQVAYYDSVIKTALPRGPHLNDENQEDVRTANGRLYWLTQRRIMSLRDYFNKTDGIQYLQLLTGCELLESDNEGRLFLMEAFDGEGGDVVYYNKNEGFVTDWKWPFPSQTYETSLKLEIKEFFHPLCIRVCRKYQRREKNRIEKQEKPRVWLLQKTLTGGAKVTCLATGFYPRHINLTLLRDGQPLSDHQITGGELLPNGDETYQMRKSLEVSTEELQHHHYTCTAEHLSLDNMMIIIEAEPESGDLPSLSLLVGLLFMTMVCLICAMVALVMWRRRKRSMQDHMTAPNTHTLKDLDTHTSLTCNYTSAPNTDETEENEDKLKAT